MPSPQPNEVWKDIPGYVGFYQASSLGQIRSLPRNGTRKNGTVLIPWISDRDRRCVRLSVAGIVTQHSIAVLVARAFLGMPLEGTEVNHKDGNHRNDCPSNFEYITHKENMKYAALMGLTASRENNGNAKLTGEKVAELKGLYGKFGWDGPKLAEKFGIGKTQVYRILRGEHWNDNTARNLQRMSAA